MYWDAATYWDQSTLAGSSTSMMVTLFLFGGISNWMMKRLNSFYLSKLSLT